LARSDDSGGGYLGCLFICGVIALIGFLGQVFDDKANKPESKQPERPKLEEATVYVTGDDGEAYKLSYVVETPDGKALRREQATGVIEPEPESYSIDLKGFRTDHNENALMKTDIEIAAYKTQRWEGDLTTVLEVNGKVVDCMTDDSVHPGEGAAYPISFDADDPEQYEGDIGCRLELRFF